MTDNRRECSFLGAVAELAFPIIYTTLHHSGANSHIRLRNSIAPLQGEPESISSGSSKLTGRLGQSRQTPFAGKPSSIVQSKSTAPEPTALHHRRRNAGHRNSATTAQPGCGRQPHFPGGRRARSCRELPSTGAQWKLVEVRQEADRNPAAYPDQAVAKTPITRKRSTPSPP